MAGGRRRRRRSAKGRRGRAWRACSPRRAVRARPLRRIRAFVRGLRSAIGSRCTRKGAGRGGELSARGRMVLGHTRPRGEGVLSARPDGLHRGSMCGWDMAPHPAPTSHGHVGPGPRPNPLDPRGGHGPSTVAHTNCVVHGSHTNVWMGHLPPPPPPSSTDGTLICGWREVRKNAQNQMGGNLFLGPDIPPAPKSTHATAKCCPHLPRSSVFCPDLPPRPLDNP